MSKSNTFETDFLRLVFNNTGISLVGDATGLPGSATAGSLYVSLHTADPGEAGDQTTNETSYTGYARVAVARSGANWVVTNNSVSPNAAITFGACTAGTASITHFAVGTSLSGAGKLLYKGAISPTISVSSGVTPQLTTATAITED
jgi:hypothetical protein